MNIHVKGPRPFKPGLAVATTGAEDRRRRKEAVRAIHIKDEFFQEAADEFNDLLKAVEDDEPEMPSFVMRGPTGAGKSHILRHLMTDERLKSSFDDWGEVRRFQYVRAPAPCNLSTLGTAIHAALTGESLSTRTTTPDIWVRTRSSLYALGVRVLMVDELQHVFLGKDKAEMAKLMGTLKCLLLGQEDPDLFEDIGKMPDTVIQYPIALVVAGMPWIKRVIATDGQFMDRCVFQTIKPFGNTALDDKAMKAYLDLYAKRLGFPETPCFSDPDLMLRFRRATNAYRGRMARLIKRAAIRAINRGVERPDWRSLLAEVFEKTYEVGAAKNPFIVADVKNLPKIKEIEMDESTRLKGKGLSALGNDDED